VATIDQPSALASRVSIIFRNRSIQSGTFMFNIKGSAIGLT
jgi:tetrahydromethanopterin S-methyltransferase subunit F